MYFSARTEGRVSYGHLGRTNSCFNKTHKLCGAKISHARRVFDLSTSYKWDHRSHGSWADFLTIFSCLRHSVLDLGSGTGQPIRQTDRQTDRERPSMHYIPTYGAEHNNNCNNTTSIVEIIITIIIVVVVVVVVVLVISYNSQSEPSHLSDVSDRDYA